MKGWIFSHNTNYKKKKKIIAFFLSLLQELVTEWQEISSSRSWKHQGACQRYYASQALPLDTQVFSSSLCLRFTWAYLPTYPDFPSVPSEPLTLNSVISAPRQALSVVCQLSRVQFTSLWLRDGSYSTPSKQGTTSEFQLHLVTMLCLWSVHSGFIY